MAKGDKSKNVRKDRKLSIDKLEERVAPAMMGGLIPGAEFDGSEPMDMVEGETFDDGTLVQDVDAVEVDDGTLLDDGTIGVEGEVVEGEWSAEDLGFGADADIHEDGSVTFAAPDGWEFDGTSGTIDIPAGETDGVIPNFPEGTSFDADGYVSYELPSGAELTPDGNVFFSEPVLPGHIAPFIPGAEILPDGAYSFPMPEGMEVGPGFVSVEGFEATLPDSAHLSEDGSSMVFTGPADPSTFALFSPDAALAEDGSGALFSTGGLSIDLDAQTYAVPVDIAPEFDGFFPPGSSITPDGGFHYEAPDGFEMNDDGTVTVPGYDVVEGEEIVEGEGSEIVEGSADAKVIDNGAAEGDIVEGDVASDDADVAPKTVKVDPNADVTLDTGTVVEGEEVEVVEGDVVEFHDADQVDAALADDGTVIEGEETVEGDEIANDDGTADAKVIDNGAAEGDIVEGDVASDDADVAPKTVKVDPNADVTLDTGTVVEGEEVEVVEGDVVEFHDADQVDAALADDGTVIEGEETVEGDEVTNDDGTSGK